ncbi:nuclear transport factor 2 family protein [Cedecea sp. NFIX57]|uniref:nuclear transport factor 2 family protein n=1 Tax=Cedecea sp. NFIX57 TaxID=1566286 RepID=UPI000A0DE5E5|nr:nuclear transport factor 2 family protein [Cedecea sp. NFIX57]SMG62084.1 Ketosteroid isomerase homolog [Cedecea sp. NFIX57]
MKITSFSRWFIMSGVLLLLISTTPSAQANPKDETDVAAREQAWSHAWVAGDLSALESLHNPDYFAINNIGQFTSRKQVIDDVRAGLFRYTSMLHKNVQIRIYGQTAVVNGLTINQGHRGSRDVSGQFAYTRVYLKNDGIWRAVLSQYTRIPATATNQ